MPENISNENTKHISVRPLGLEDLSDVCHLWHNIVATGDNVFFHPHPFDIKEATKVCAYEGKDLYLAAFIKEEMVGYGMLRGWDAGYETPSLGIYIQKNFQGRGVAKWFMTELHKLAAERGSKKVRLTVSKENERAIRLYRKLGYELIEHENFFEGFLLI